MFSPDVLDPSSAAYKKARRRHLKTTKHRPDTADTAWTPFRAAEKRYKARFPPPDLADVLDLAAANPARRAEIAHGRWVGRADAVTVREIALKDGGGRAYIFVQIPGLVLLPAFLHPEAQRELVRWSLAEHARPPNATNLDTHYELPPGGLWSTALHAPHNDIPPRARPENTAPSAPGPRTLVDNPPASPAQLSTEEPKLPAPPADSARPMSAGALVRKLRWANIGWFYHWGTKTYDFARGKPPVHPRVRGVCADAVQRVPWDAVFAGQEDWEGWGADGPDWDGWDETYEPDAGIVNFYQTGDTLMAHVDRSELCATSPLVSLSLGNAAVFLIGGLTRDVPPVPILLRSGDVVIMAGPACRRAYHGVPRILEGTLPEHLQDGAEKEEEGDWKPYAEYMRTTRINVNVRQVFPKGFDPGLHIEQEACV